MKLQPKARAERRLDAALDKKLAAGELFQLDASGSSKGQPKSLRRALAHEKVAKGAKRLSALEVEKLKRQPW